MDRSDGDDFDVSALLDELNADTSWMPPEDPALSAAMHALGLQVQAMRKANSPARKPECSATSPSQKISIRIPKTNLECLKDEAAERGVPYQTLINQILSAHLYG